ncbi:CAAX prenyl protease 2 isoform 2-T2 [Leptodactylus fuscus]|uniref:CAAX prenyl protease 2 isoform X2 n=1 Tax=Leptodactylus fuscus TaxID=238119 RepID=UPI003F4F22D7
MSEAPVVAAAAAASGHCVLSILCCLTLACSYVGSLYVWKSELSRDHPAVIKRRFTSVLIVSSLSPLVLWVWRELTGIKTDAAILSLMGFRLDGILTATTLPLLLTMVLFLGPLVQLSLDCPWGLIDGLKVAVDPRFWILCFTDMRWLRNQVIAPLTEELVFRACMLPMLVPCTSPGTAIFTCPLFFGIGHFIGPVLCHSFCNYIGFPAIFTALDHPQRSTIVLFYVLGVVLFFLLLYPMTDPTLYGDIPICSLLDKGSTDHRSLCL